MLTKRQKDALEFIAYWQAKRRGQTPSMTQIKAGLGLNSKANVHRLVSCLEERGFIERDSHNCGSHVTRPIRILKTAGGGKQPPFQGAIPIYDAATHEIRGWLAQ
jgi:repressor LexA